jgi:hypothetical protein
MFARKKVFLLKRWLEVRATSRASNPQPTKELTHHTGALAITTVGSLNKNCGSKVLYKGSIVLKMIGPASEVTGGHTIPF